MTKGSGTHALAARRALTQKVILEYVEGDTDRPIVIDALYNCQGLA